MDAYPFIAIIIGSLLGLGGTITAYILIIPEDKKAGLNKFLLFLHDVFTFKSLLLEKIVRFFYVLNTISCITIGFFLLFAGSTMTLMGFAMIIIAPVVVRLVYEGFMMFILLVKNTIEINNKFEKK
ncbi:MAG: hypothetical protein FWE60_04145 [Oscillospiraceae bacterium]|nr:hypothetical protein [Oscillospiraceae bacterium]